MSIQRVVRKIIVLAVLFRLLGVSGFTDASAEAYTTFTYVAYNQTTTMLSGYAYTRKDLFDASEGLVWYPECECTLYYAAWSNVTSYLYSPDSGLVGFGTVTDRPDATLGLVPFRPMEIGYWVGISSHYTKYRYYFPSGAFAGEVTEFIRETGFQAYVNCVVPSGETTQHIGWSTNPADVTIPLFEQTVLPVDNVYLTIRRVNERDYAPPADGCYFPDSAKDPIPTLDSQGINKSLPPNHKYIDQVGWTADAVTYYRAARPAAQLPLECQGTYYQEMFLVCSDVPLAYAYKHNQMVMTIGSQTVSTFRNGVTATKNWPNLPNPGPAGGPDWLVAGAQLAPWQYRDSQNGAYRLVYQGSDGNLVLYGPSGPEWASAAPLHVPGYTSMQGSDGNLVTYDSTGQPRWDSSITQPGASLRVGNDGRVRIYSQSGAELWSRP